MSGKNILRRQTAGSVIGRFLAAWRETLMGY